MSVVPLKIGNNNCNPGETQRKTPSLCKITTLDRVNLAEDRHQHSRGGLSEFKHKMICPGKPRLQGKVSIVTGSGANAGKVGTGMATAICLASEGAKVLVADVSKENAMRTVERIRDETGGEALVYTGDATKSEDCLAMVKAAVDGFGALHVLVNNLGYGISSSYRNSGKSKGIAGIDEQEWENAFDLNLKSAMLASRHAIPEMIAAGGGSIINVSSCDGIAGSNNYGAPYSVSKGALHMLTRTTAAWHGRDGIRANCIAPGHLHSAFTLHLDEEHRERRRRVVPLGTEGTPWDIAWAAVFLASDESRWISGVTLPVDGGLFAAQPLLAYEFIKGEPTNNKELK